MRLRDIVLITAIAGSVASCARHDDRVVATVDGYKITASMFRERYLKTQEPGGVRDNIVRRQQILSNMINERLILADADRQDFADRADFRKRMEEISSQALLDAYARRISVDTMTVNEAELWEEFRAQNTKVKARYLYASSEERAWELKDRIQSGATFEQLARDVFDDPGLANNGGDLGYFGWGEMESGLEEVAFTQPVGDVSDPVRLSMGFAIVRVDNRVHMPLSSEQDYAQKRQTLEEVVRQRKTIRLVKALADGIRQSLSPAFNENAVQEVFKDWAQITQTQNVEMPGTVRSTAEPALSEQQMVRFRDRGWTVREFLEKAGMTTPRQRARVKSADDVKQIAVGLAIREEILARAKRLGLEKDSLVTRQIDVMQLEYKLKYWSRSVRDSVGQHGWPEAELRAYFESNRDKLTVPPEANVAEILVATLPEAQHLREKLTHGGDFAALARRHSLRRWAAQRGGELGYGPKSSYGVLGERIFAVGVGELIGPEFVDPYYGVFKVLGKRPARPMTFEEARETIISHLSSLRKQEVFVEAVQLLRSTASINIDIDALAHVTLE